MYLKNIGQKLKKFILQNRDLFSNKDSELGKTDTVKLQIDTGNSTPIKMKPYRTPIKIGRLSIRQ